jgi:hypothetical protein
MGWSKLLLMAKKIFRRVLFYLSLIITVNGAFYFSLNMYSSAHKTNLGTDPIISFYHLLFDILFDQSFGFFFSGLLSAVTLIVLLVIDFKSRKIESVIRESFSGFVDFLVVPFFIFWGIWFLIFLPILLMVIIIIFFFGVRIGFDRLYIDTSYFNDPTICLSYNFIYLDFVYAILSLLSLAWGLIRIHKKDRWAYLFLLYALLNVPVNFSWIYPVILNWFGELPKGSSNIPLSYNIMGGVFIVSLIGVVISKKQDDEIDDDEIQIIT